MAEQRYCDDDIGRRLYGHLLRAGFADVAGTTHQPVFVRGSERRLGEHTFREAVPFLVAGDPDRGLTSSRQATAICNELHRLTQDESLVYGLPMMMQVRGRRR